MKRHIIKSMREKTKNYLKKKKEKGRSTKSIDSTQLRNFLRQTVWCNFLVLLCNNGH